MNALISVVVPVYKVEPFLDYCIGSIVNQTYNNLEIILVDDGSPDRCPEICDAWARKDSRIRVIHQSNGGGGKARNSALDIAKGEFITFVDSDDYISPIMYEFLYQQFNEDIDIVECDYSMTKDNNAQFDKYDTLYHSKCVVAEIAMKENIDDCIFRQLLWNKMYRKSVIADIRFPVGKKIDDEFWTYKVLSNARKLVCTDKVLYAYRQQDKSVMHSLNATRRLEAIEAKIQRHEFICNNMPSLEETSLCNLWGTCIYQGQLAIKTMNGSDRVNIFEQLEEILKKYPIGRKKLNVPMKQRVWLQMANFSFEGTCIIRNLLKVGL